jgi:hypothetical protein
MVTQVRAVGYSTRKETGRYRGHLTFHFVLQRSSMGRSISALRVSLHSILLLGLFYVPWMMGWFRDGRMNVFTNDGTR